MSAALFEVEAEAEASLLSSGAVTVEITDVCPTSRRVTAGDLRLGDLLFDAFGGTHEIVEKTRSRNSAWVDTVRDDGFEDRFHKLDTITIIRPDQEV